MLPRLVAFLGLVLVVSSQCSFNTLAIFAGSHKLTGLTVGTAFGGKLAVTASSGTNGKYVYTPASATLVAEKCAANTGTATSVGDHLFSEDGLYTCAVGKSCSVAQCTSQCDAGVVNPKVDCNADCILGTQSGQVVTTKLLGSGGADCSGATIPMTPNSPTCVVSAVEGYTCKPTGGGSQTLPATVTCTTAGATLIANSCTENVCNTVDVTKVTGVVGNSANNDQCGDKVVLSAVSDPSCDIKCDQSAGYTAQTGTYKCDNKKGGVDPVSSITACVPVACPANSSMKSLKHCVCDDGYTGVITYTGLVYTGTCKLIECAAYNFPTNPQSIISGDTDGCKGGDVLSIKDKTCNVKCADGYVAATGIVTCDYAVTKKSTTPLTCTEKACSAYNFGTGITGGVNKGCSNPQTLKQVSSPSCTLSCAPGYSGADGTLTCPTSLGGGAAPIVNIDCKENTCSAYTLQDGEVAAAPGCGALKTVTGNTCTLSCLSGYTSGSGSVKCPATAAGGTAPTVVSSPNCRKTCALHKCGNGFLPKSVTTTVCDAAGCTDAVCCDAASCPSNSKTSTTDGSLTPPTCECLNGFVGTALWDTSKNIWSHTCTAHCGNTFFVGCDTNSESLIPNPSATLCGNGNCDAGGCAACPRKTCCVENVCTAPGSTFPNHIFGGAKGDKCTTVASCAPVTCTDGYKGTPVLQCKGSGSKFTFSPQCVPSDCPKWAGPPGTCKCNAGYQIVGGGDPVFDKNTRAWTHTCKLTCAHSSFTGCNKPDVTLVSKPEEVFCTGTSGNPNLDCTSATCCRDTCSKFSCPASGFSKKSNPSTIACPSAGCDEATCCLATCGHSGFVGCSAAGYTPKANQNSITCASNAISSCTTDICCHSTTCDTVKCSSGSLPISPKPSCSICTETVCCLENTCAALTAGQYPEYIVAGGTSCTSVSKCNPVGCRAGYRQDPIAQLSCPSNGGTFSASGCVENVCQSTSLSKYVTAVQPCTSVSQCGKVTCATGYHTNSGSEPSVLCSTHGGTLTGTGCVENVCKPPATATGITGVTFTGPTTCTTVTACGVISCARGYSQMGTPSISCLQEGGEFAAFGCSPLTCKQHLTTPHDGYSVVVPTCTSVDKCGKVSCDNGYEATGTPSIVCPTANGNFEYSGCTRVPCPTGASGSQCICDNGYTGTPKWEASKNNWTHTCTMLPCPQNSSGAGCPCEKGYRGTPQWSGSKWTHTCTLSDCGPNQSGAPNCQCDAGYSGTPSWSGSNWDNVCKVFTCSKGFKGSVAAGYNIQNFPCTTSAACGTVTCKNGYVANNPRVVCDSQDGFLTVTGCDAATCPVGAAPSGECSCTSGYVGSPSPTFNGRVWVGTCTPQPCPTNSDNIPGTCACLSGYAGTPQWSGSRWSHTCQLSTCPVNSAGTPRCVCNSGFSGTLTWSSVSNSWTGTCSSSSCPANSARSSNNICVCNNGYRGLVNGVGSCSAVACPTGASPVGICACPGGSPAPVWNPSSGAWAHTCTTTCGSNSVISNGVCVCANGYTGKVNGVGVCTAVPCPVGASPEGVCNCPGNGPAAVWNSATGKWTHSCNISPTATLTSQVVGINTSVSSVVIPSFLVSVAAPEVTQSLTASCVASVPSLFSSQPSLTLSGNTATLTFTRAPTASSGTSSSVSCSLTDDGTPALTTTVVFTISINNDNTLPCGTTGGTCTFPSSVEVGVGSEYNSPFLTTSGTTTSCTAVNKDLFSTQPTVSSNGQLTFSSGDSVGESTVTCVTTAAGATGGSSFSFIIRVTAAGNQWLRVYLAVPVETFVPASFQRAISDILLRAGISVFGIDIKYACPASACGATSATSSVNSLVCPATHALRVSASCVFDFGSDRQIEVLQNNVNAATGTAVVDFDIITGQVDDSQPKQAERIASLSALNAEATQCTSGSGSCAFTQNGVPLVTGTNLALTPTTTEATPLPAYVSDSDDDFPWWGWVLIAAGVVLLCCCLLTVGYFACYKKSDDTNKRLNNYQEKEMSPANESNPGPSYSYGSYYGTSYSSSYVPETFVPGDAVRAQYIDGVEYDAEIYKQDADGTYVLKWFDGSHSEGVPADQIIRR